MRGGDNTRPLTKRDGLFNLNLSEPTIQGKLPTNGRFCKENRPALQFSVEFRMRIYLLCNLILQMARNTCYHYADGTRSIFGGLFKDLDCRD